MMIQWLFISGYVLQNMLQVGFGKTFQNLPYFDQSVAYARRDLESLKKSSVNGSHGFSGARASHVVNMNDNQRIASLVETGIKGRRRKAKRRKETIEKLIEER